ncbi:MAG: hypothetical protein ACRENP_13775 [Longimicrobiales bacterium]
MPRPQWLLWWLTLQLMLPLCASAQLALGGDLTVRSRYVWRGVVRTSRPVVQPSVFVSWQPINWTVTAGAWASLEPWRASSIQFTEAGRSTTWAELDYWLEAHTRVRAFDLRVGTIRYDLQGDSLAGGRADVWDTGEVYGAAVLLLSRLSTVGLYAAYDYDAIDGAYFALEALQHVPFLEVHGMTVSSLLRAELAASLGQASDSGVEQPAYFTEDGVSHIDVSAAMRVHTRRVGFHATGHLQFGRDPQARRITLTRNAGAFTWFEAGLALVVGPLARERR